MKRLLIVDDDRSLVAILKLFLEKESYQVVTALDGSEGLHRFYEDRPDLVILDIMMPCLDGWQVCERIHEMSDTPVIMLTARDRKEDVIKGLKSGADDYLAKPFDFRELAARVAAVLRRSRSNGKPDEKGCLYADDYLVIDADRKDVLCAGERVNLTAIEHQMLFLLAKNQNRLLTPRQILTGVWGCEYADESSYVRLYIWRLRQKIEPVPESPCYIVTEYGLGYRFVGHT